MVLPRGARVRLNPTVARHDDGRLLVGGSPFTLFRLSDRARQLIGSDGDLVVEGDDSAYLARRLVGANLAAPELNSLPEVSSDQLTVVVPVRDRTAQLDRCLTALGGLAVVVVDDASLDPVAVAAVAHRHGATLLPLTTNVGPADARNAGTRTVTTPLVAYVDSDVEVSAASLLLLARHLADPEVAVVGPRVGGVARSEHPRWFERYDAAASSLALGRTPNTVRPGAEVAWLPSACLVGRTTVLREVGFNASMRVGEDVDAVWRLVDAGHVVRYEPAVDAAHDVRGTVRAWLGRKAFYGSGGADLAARHGDRLAPAVLSPGAAVTAALLLVRSRWALPVAIAHTAWTAYAVRRRLPEVEGRTRLAASIAVRGLGWAVRQESGLVLRHWWPATAALVWAQPVRRAASSSLLVDAGVAWLEHRHHRDPLPPHVVLVGRRLDDLAYGGGLWWGALRAGSVRALVPRRPAKG